MTFFYRSSRAGTFAKSCNPFSNILDLPLKLSNVPYSIKVFLNYVKTNFKQKMIFIATKPSQQPRIWDLLLSTGTPPEKFLPMPLINNNNIKSQT